MKRIVYVSFEVDTESYEEAQLKIKDGLRVIDEVLSDTILVGSEAKDIREVFATNKIVNHTKI